MHVHSNLIKNTGKELKHEFFFENPFKNRLRKICKIHKLYLQRQVNITKKFNFNYFPKFLNINEHTY